MTGYQLAKRKLALKVLEAVKEFESFTGHTAVTFDIPALRTENEPLEDAIKTSTD